VNLRVVLSAVLSGVLMTALGHPAPSPDPATVLPVLTAAAAVALACAVLAWAATRVIHRYCTRRYLPAIT
jgi:hypothetical protein